MWAATAMVCAFFTWYAWYSLEAPFVLHEVHTFDPAKAAAEKSRVEFQGAIIYALLLAWLISSETSRTWNQFDT
jgi:hypothetical protein